MMLKLAFEPEHALEVEEITGFSNTITGRLIWEMGLEEDEITWYSNKQDFVRKTEQSFGRRVKLHDSQTAVQTLTGFGGV